MTLTAPEIYNRLTELDSDDNSDFTLATHTSESDVQTWYDGIDVAQLESDADSQIDRTTVTDLTQGNIGPDNLSVNEVIRSRNDDPSDYEAAYLIRGDRTFVQYFKPKVGGKEPIPEAEVESWMSDHVAELVDRTVNAELLDRAKTEFGQS
jgi:hypothetical protein